MRTSLRLPPDLYASVKEAAETEQRSLNTQIERFLREAVERWRRRRQQGGEEGYAYPRVAEGPAPPYRPHGDT